MSQPAQSNPTTGQGIRGLASIGLALIAILSLAVAGYTVMNPHIVTVTQQQVLTNTQSVFNTQTVTSVSTLATVTTVTSTSISTANGYLNLNAGGIIYQNCAYYGCYSQAPTYGSLSDLCKSTGQNSTVQCSGYLYEPSSACTELAIPYINVVFMETQGYLYVTLYNLPSNHPAPGTYVTVTGQPSQGFAPGPSGEQACTDNTITVASIS